MKQIQRYGATRCMLAACLGLAATAADTQREIVRPDGQPANMSKPVKVFILLGQSNMLGFGHVSPEDKEGTLEHAVRKKGMYKFMVDDPGRWVERHDVRYVQVMPGRGGMKVVYSGWLTVPGKFIGPEQGIGHVMGQIHDEPVLILKSCIGNRSLGWDLLPPGSPRYEFEGKLYAGYRESPMSWDKGTEPKPINWYAGKQYDDDVANAKAVLAELEKYYPGAKKYEIAGFFFWQGEKDRGVKAHAARYETNLVNFIQALRRDFNAPKAPFVLGTLGDIKKGVGGNDGMILEAQLAVDGQTGKYPEFRGNVATVYTHPLCRGGGSNAHYGGNAETYMDVGIAMGWAMANLLKR